MGSGVWKVLNPDNPALLAWLQCVIGDTVAIYSAEPVKSVRNKYGAVEIYYLMVRAKGNQGGPLLDDLEKHGKRYRYMSL